jgi:LysM repeat protein
VEPGDTLFSIARRNNTTVDALVAANNLATRDSIIVVGQRLALP